LSNSFNGHDTPPKNGHYTSNCRPNTLGRKWRLGVRLWVDDRSTIGQLGVSKTLEHCFFAAPYAHGHHSLLSNAAEATELKILNYTCRCLMVVAPVFDQGKRGAEQPAQCPRVMANHG
jgi:hypothetical protein